jgi:hypothetical protein
MNSFLLKLSDSPTRVFAVALSLIVGLSSVAYAAASVHHLFSEYVGLAGVEPPLAALSTVGLTVALLLLTVTTSHQNTRGMCAILLLAWLLITLALVGTDSALRAQIVTVPVALIAVGRAVAAILPALALLACVLVVLAMHDRDSTRSAGAAAAHYLGFAAKLAGIGASVIASGYFGIQRGIDPVLAVFLGVVLESCFVWSYLSTIKAREKADLFDVAMWSIATLLFGAFIAAVSVETVSTLTGISVPIVATLGDVGASLYVSAVGLSIALAVVTHLLTRAIDIPIEVRPLRGVARHVRNLREDAEALREALRTPAREGVIFTDRERVVFTANGKGHEDPK